MVVWGDAVGVGELSAVRAVWHAGCDKDADEYDDACVQAGAGAVSAHLDCHRVNREGWFW